MWKNRAVAILPVGVNVPGVCAKVDVMLMPIANIIGQICLPVDFSSRS